ncbi:MAG: protein involved in catabolism of external [Gammaproteobacteria bacterium]|jgi:23S rRNA (adenine2030-N6)-methyltransferase|nr:protein involved in catabolism of external [Gammaproteobacteria bacterium]
MNYDHSFHAGSFTDVFKHITLMCLIQKLQLKEKGFGYLDTHSAYPYYQLQAKSEADTGIRKLWQAKNLSPTLRQYLNLIDAFNEKLNAKRVYYPGSAAFAWLMRRSQDSLILNDIEDEPYQALKAFFKKDSSVHCHHQDAYQLMKALLPLKERRGLVLIDPAFEVINEFDLLTRSIESALQRWPQGVYAIWYPIKHKHAVERFLTMIEKKTQLPVINFKCCPWPDDVNMRLSGSGMLIINPPWQIEQVLNPAILEIERVLREA